MARLEVRRGRPLGMRLHTLALIYSWCDRSHDRTALHAQALKEKIELFADSEFYGSMLLGHRLIDSRWFEKNSPTESG